MAFCDFAIRYDPKKDTKNDITEKILHALVVKRLKGKKPTAMFIGGESGSGKSYAALKIQEIILKQYGIKLTDVLHDINVYNPTEYPVKLENLLFSTKATETTLKQKSLKKAPILAVHEARTVIPAKMWHNFVNQAIGDVNAMSRSIKRMLFIIVSQFIRDISSDIRYTLNYYCIVKRKNKGPARLYINVMWKDDRDIEKPKLRKRRIQGYLIYPNGRYRRFVPEYIELSKPPKEIIEEFEKQDFESKGKIIHQKMEKMIKEMQIEQDVGTKKIDAMVDFYLQDIDKLYQIGKRNKNGWKVKPAIRDMHDLTKIELTEFQDKLNAKLIEKQLVPKSDE